MTIISSLYEFVCYKGGGISRMFLCNSSIYCHFYSFVGDQNENRERRKNTIHANGNKFPGGH